MKILTLPLIEAKFVEKMGKTVISCQNGNEIVTVWVDGNKADSKALLCNIVVNEVGDTFVANRDSSTKDTEGAPLYLKGDIVERKKQSVEFKSFTGDNTAAQFAQSASAFKLQLVVQM